MGKFHFTLLLFVGIKGFALLHSWQLFYTTRYFRLYFRRYKNTLKQ